MLFPVTHRIGGNRQRYYYRRTLIKNRQKQKAIAICRPIGDKRQSKTLFLAIFDPRSSIDKSVLNCRLFGVSKSFSIDANLNEK